MSYCCSHPWVQGGGGRRKNLLCLGQGISSIPPIPLAQLTPGTGHSLGSHPGHCGEWSSVVGSHPLNARSIPCCDNHRGLQTSLLVRPPGLGESLGKPLLPKTSELHRQTLTFLSCSALQKVQRDKYPPYSHLHLLLPLRPPSFSPPPSRPLLTVQTQPSPFCSGYHAPQGPDKSTYKRAWDPERMACSFIEPCSKQIGEAGCMDCSGGKAKRVVS